MGKLTQPIPFGALLKRYRRAAGLTQEALAERAGYSVTYLSKLERSERQPLAFTVGALADALGLAPDERAVLEDTAQSAPTLRLVRALPQTSTSEAEGAAKPLVGRANELARLKRFLAGEGPPVLLLSGEPGIGKTRLLEEAAGWGRAQGWQVLMGCCRRASGQEPYDPLIEMLTQFLGQRPPVDQQQLLAGCSWLVRLLPELAEEGHLSPPTWNLVPDQERRLLFAAVGRFLSNVAGPAGTLLILDDLHWTGADMLDLLVSLVRTRATAPVRILGASCQTDVGLHAQLTRWLAELARLNVVEPLQVDPLPRAEAAVLLRSLLIGSSAEGQPALEEQILQRAGGVPYFLVSYAQGLRAGALHWQGPEETIDEVPWGVAETIRQRVAALPETARYLLGAVSIVGQETPRALLLGLATQLGWGKLDVLEAVERACQARLLEERESGVYRIPHELIREVIEAELSGMRRMILHQQVAEILEQQPGAPPLERLAYHSIHGEQPEKAIHYLERAGDRSAAMYAHAEAEQAYRMLLDLVTQLGRETAIAGVQEKLAGILRAAGRYSEAIELLEAVQSIYQGVKDLEGLARVRGKVGQLHAARGTADTGIVLLEPWLTALPPDAISAQQQGELCLTLAYLFLNSSRYHEALAAAEQAAAFAEQAHNDRLFGQAQWHIGRSLLLLNRLEEAVQRFEAALPLAEGAGDVFSLYYIYLNLDLITHSRGNLRESRFYSERAIALAEQMGNPLLLAQALGSHAHTVWSQGEWQQSRQENERAIALFRQIGMPWGATYPLLNVGLQSLAEGQMEASCVALEEAVFLARRNQDLQALGLAQSALAEQDLVLQCPVRALERLESLLEDHDLHDRGVEYVFPCLAMAHLELGHEAQACLVLDQALDRATSQQMRLLLAETRHVQGIVATRQGKWQRAEALLEEALGMYRVMEMPYGEAKVRGSMGVLALQQSKWAQANEQLQAALEICSRLGERLYATRMEQTLAEVAPGSMQALLIAR